MLNFLRPFALLRLLGLLTLRAPNACAASAAPVPTRATSLRGALPAGGALTSWRTDAPAGGSNEAAAPALYSAVPRFRTMRASEA